MIVLNSAQSKELEKEAVKAGTDYLQLMENAGTAAVRYLQKRFRFEQKKIVILCGKGNNGGDGYVAARRLSELGALTVVVLVQGLPATDISNIMFSKLENTSVKIISNFQNTDMLRSMLASADFIIDAVYGTGFHGAVREHLLPLFQMANQSPATMVSLDMPSGANCDTGEVEGACIQAEYTISFSTLKNGHLLSPARYFCGQVVVVPIGIDSKLIQKQKTDFHVTELGDVKALIKPRNPESNKGDYGRLLCLCGSEGMAGAAIMSTKAAIRCGTGIVHTALPRSIYSIVSSHVIESVYTLLDYNQDGSLTSEALISLDTALSKASACLIGCGLGTSKNTVVDTVRNMITKSTVPLIIDADGINIIAENINVLQNLTVPVVLTPHPGEMARLCNTGVADIQAHRFQYAKDFAEKHRVILVLKGAGTIVALPNGEAYLNLTGNAGMAKGGSGDVLAGMIASFIAQKMDPAKAAAAAVYLHGEAGDRCAKKLSQCAMLPTDLIEILPELFLDIEKQG
jgi:NAD(P)H-hydrate epimerase